MRKIVLLIVFAVFLSAGAAHAKNLTFRAEVDKNRISASDSFMLNLTFDGTTEMPAPELSKIDGFKTRYIGPSTKMSIVNGRMSSSVTHVYVLVPLKTGVFELGPFSFSYMRDAYTSNPLTVEVVEGPVEKEVRPPIGYSGEDERLKDRIFVTMEAKKTKAYLNEIVPLSIKLYVYRLSVQDIQYPEFSQEGLSVSGFEEPIQYKEFLANIPYHVMEFKTNVFGTKAGKFLLNPAIIKCNVLEKQRRRRAGFEDFYDDDLFQKFFGNVDIFPLELESREISMTILPLPEEGKPAAFTGAVGNFTFKIEVTPRKLKVGDPVTLKMIVGGDGSFNTVMPPETDFGSDFKTYEPRASRKGGNKIFEQVLMPTTTNIKEIPAIGFSFFDPDKKKYLTITTKPTPIEVTKPKKIEGLKIIENGKATPLRSTKEEVIGSDILYIKEAPGALRKKGTYLFKNKAFLFLLALGLVAFVALLMVQKRQARLKKDVRYRRRLVAPKKAKTSLKKAEVLLGKKNAEEFYRLIFKTVQEYFGDKFHLPAHGITITIIDEVLRPKAVEEDVLMKLKSIFEDCDLARYAASSFDAAKMKDTFKKTCEVVDYFERARI